VDLDDGALLGRPLDGLKFGEQKGLQYAPNGSYLIVGHCNNNDKTIHVIDGHTLNVIDRVPAGGTTYDITVNSSSTAFAAGVDKSIVVWSLPQTR
jgi:DNA-binding beta-propeller fold protein YncE